MKIKLLFLHCLLLINFLSYSQGFSTQKKEINKSLSWVNLPNSKGYVDATKYLPKNYKMDGSVNYTVYIQKALNENKKIIFPNFPVLVDGLVLSSNSNLYFQKNSKLIMKPTNKTHYMVLFLSGIENVNIYNARIVGDYSRHIGTSGEWGYGIDIRGSRNIKIYNSIISDCWGDGICISSNSNQFTADIKLLPTQNILIKNSILDYNRRNGITIASGVSDVIIDNVQISNTFGTLPKAAIDFEPDHSKGKLQNILIKNSSFFNNSAGINFHLNQYSNKSVSNLVSVKVINVKFKDQESSFYFGGYKEQPNIKKLNGLIDIDGVTIENVGVPISRRNNSYGTYPDIKFKNFYHIKAGKRVKDNNGLMKGVNDKSNFQIQ